MAQLKLKGSTVIETLVAFVLFALITAIGTSTIVSSSKDNSLNEFEARQMVRFAESGLDSIKTSNKFKVTNEIHPFKTASKIDVMSFSVMDENGKQLSAFTKVISK